MEVKKRTSVRGLRITLSLPPPSEIVPYEQVVKQLAADTIATDATLGHKGGRFSCGKFSQAAFITIKVLSGIVVRISDKHLLLWKCISTM